MLKEFGEEIVYYYLHITRSCDDMLYILEITRYRELGKRIDLVSGKYKDEEEFINAVNRVFEVEEPDKTKIQWTHTRGAFMYPAGDITFRTKRKIVYEVNKP